MNLIFKFCLSYLVLLNIINSLVVLPLYHQQKKINISSSYEFINNYMNNNLYTIIQMGNPKQNIEMIITEEDIVFSIRKNKCLLKEYYFDKNKSQTFKNLTKGKGRFYESSEAEDTFFFYKNYTNIENNIIKVDNLKFVFENEKKADYKEILKYNCALLSLNLFRNNIANNDYNFILELKKLDIIDNHAWSIKYINELDNNNINPNLEGYLIIGDYPHIYEKDKYDIINMRSSLNNMNEKGWNLLFKNITISNDTILTHYMSGIISFSNSYIIGTEEYKSRISIIFFNQYVQKGICFEDNTVSHYFLYYCLKNKFNKKDINTFPDLNFFHAEFNYTFKFTKDDLFLETNNFYYFLIVFDRYDYKSWTFGKLFLKKYQLVFEHVSKKISLYTNKIEKKEIKEKNIYINNNTVLIIVLVSIACFSFIIGLVIGKIKFSFKKRNKRANELDNENEDYFIKKKESFNESDVVTNFSEEKEIN